jgi:hypothetical protein
LSISVATRFHGFVRELRLFRGLRQLGLAVRVLRLKRPRRSTGHADVGPSGRAMRGVHRPLLARPPGVTLKPEDDG